MIMLWSKSYSLDKRENPDTQTQNSHCGYYIKTLIGVFYLHKYGWKNHLNIKETFKQSKADVIATKCLQHQSFNVLKRNII